MMKNKKPVCDSDKKKRGPEKSEMRKMAEGVGMSKHFMYLACSIAKIPEDLFEELIEQDNVPTIAELERIGKNKPKRKYARRIRVCPHCGKDLTDDKN